MVSALSVRALGGALLAVTVLAASGSCGSEDRGDRRQPAVADTDSGAPGTDTPDDSDVDGDSDSATPALAFTLTPSFSPNPNPAAPLVQILTAETNMPSHLEVELVSAEHAWSRAFEDEAGLAHALDILGLRPDRSYTATVTAVTPSGVRVEAAPLEVATPPLPAAWPDLRVVHAEPARMEPGFTFLVAVAEVDPPARYLVALDAEGEVVWFLEHELLPFNVQRAPAGPLLITSDIADSPYPGLHVLERDMRGDLLQRWSAADVALAGDIPVDAPVLHHDVQPRPGGGFFVLSAEGVVIPDYPTSEVDPGAPHAPANVATDVVLEVDRDGTVVDRWPYADYLQPRRIGYDSVTMPSWKDRFGPETRDWTHANAVVHDAASDALVMSSRHQDAVFRVDRQTRELSWILAPPANWGAAWRPYLLEPVGEPFFWFYHPHAPEITPHGTLLLFDHGNNRASAFEHVTPPGANWSRAVEYAIDPEAMTVQQVWSYAGEPRVFCPFQGDADWLPATGNVLVNFGSIHGAGAGGPPVRVVEVTHTEPAEVVFEVEIHGDKSQLFRVERIASLYP